MAALRQNSGEDLALFRISLPDGRLVFQRRTDDAPTSAGLLGFFGGHIDQGEDPETAAYRELNEETSIKPPRALVYSGRYVVATAGGEEKEAHLYDIAVDDMEFEVYEGVRAEAYSLEEALQRSDLASTVRLILDGSLKNEL